MSYIQKEGLKEINKSRKEYNKIREDVTKDLEKYHFKCNTMIFLISDLIMCNGLSIKKVRKITLKNALEDSFSQIEDVINVLYKDFVNNELKDDENDNENNVINFNNLLTKKR